MLLEIDSDQRKQIFGTQDDAIRDVDGEKFVFGASYVDVRNGETHDVAGLDLRGVNVVFTWNADRDVYDAVSARFLQRIPS